MRRVIAYSLALGLVAAACGAGETSTTGSGSPTSTTSTPLMTTTSATSATTVAPAPTTTAATTSTTALIQTTTTSIAPTTITTVPTSGPATDTCINGWITPNPGTALRTFPLDMIRAHLGLAVDDLFVVAEMRYLIGPMDVGAGPVPEVERWYVEAAMLDDPSVSGRWIVSRIDIGMGVAFEAASGTTGFAPGTWTGHEGEGGTYDPFMPACTASNGPYCMCSWGDNGCSCSDNTEVACTGPPPEVMGCLAGL